MRTTDIQIWYKQAYWSQTNQNYKHGFFYNTRRPNVGYESTSLFLIFLKKGAFFIFIHLYMIFFKIYYIF